MDDRKKMWAIWFAKFAFTCVLLAFILFNVNWSVLFENIAAIRKNMLVAVLFLGIAGIAISALKWLVLLRPFNTGFSLIRAARLYFITSFFNSFLPGIIGGDGYRGYKIYRLYGRFSAAYVPIFIERVSGLALLMLLGGLAGSYLYVTLQDTVSLTMALTGLGATAAIMLFFSLVIYREKILSLKIVRAKKRTRDLADKFSDNIFIYKEYPNVILWTAVLTFLFYLVIFYVRFLLIIATGSYIPFVVLVGIIMVSNALAMLPLSINGYGILDLSFIGLLSYYGVDYEKAVLVMLLYRCMQVLISSFGGLLYAFTRDRHFIGKRENEQKVIVFRQNESKEVLHTIVK